MLTEQQIKYKNNMVEAIQKGDLGQVIELLKNGQYFIDDDVVIQCVNLRTKNASEMLIEINEKLEKNSKILYSAISTQNHEEVKRICELGFNKEYLSPMSLDYPIEVKHGSTKKNPDHNSLILKAIKLNNIPIIETLVTAGANINKITSQFHYLQGGAGLPQGYIFLPGVSPLLYTINSNQLSKGDKLTITSILLKSSVIDLSLFGRGFDHFTAFYCAKGQPEIEKLLFHKLQEKDSLDKVEKKHFNRYMKNAMNDIFKDVKAQTRSMDINNNSNDAHIKIIDEKAKEYFPSLKGNTQYDKALKDMFDEIKLAKSKDKEASKNTLDAIVKFFEKLLRFVTNNSIEKEAFKKLELEIMPYIMKPDMKEVDKQASKPETSEKNPQSHRR